MVAWPTVPLHTLVPVAAETPKTVPLAGRPSGCGVSPYVRTVKTSSGATAVQIVYSSHRGSRDIEHLGSAHSGAEVELLKAAARQWLAAGQGELDLGLAVGVPGGPLLRRLPIYAKDSWRQKLAAACGGHAGLGPASLVLYDVSTLYFESDAGDGFREPGFSKERRLDPQITIGLLTDQTGFPLMVSAFEGNKAETKTMLPVVQSFMAAHQLPGVTVVADAGMVSEANQKQIEAAGLSFILGLRIPEVPWVIAEWHREHSGADGHVFTQALACWAAWWPPGPHHLLPLPARPGPAHLAWHR